MGDASEPIQADLPWLYELSLTLGRTLDPGASCRGFLRALVTRPGLTGAAIWWCAAEGLRLLDAWPRGEAPPGAIPLTHPIWRLSRGGEPRVLRPGEVEPGALGWDAMGETAAIALCRLGADGVLLLRSSELDLFDPPMLARLGGPGGQPGPGDPRRAGAGAPGVLRGRAAGGRAPLPPLADARTVLIRTSGLDRGCDYVNQPWLRFTGRGLEQELGLGWVEMVHPEDQALCLETYAKAFDRRRPFGIEYRLRRVDGEYRWIRDDGSPHHDSQGAFWATSTIATTSPSAGWGIPLRPALKSGWSCQRAL